MTLCICVCGSVALWLCGSVALWLCVSGCGAECVCVRCVCGVQTVVYELTSVPVVCVRMCVCVCMVRFCRCFQWLMNPCATARAHHHRCIRILNMAIYTLYNHTHVTTPLPAVYVSRRSATRSRLSRRWASGSSLRSSTKPSKRPACLCVSGPRSTFFPPKQPFPWIASTTTCLADDARSATHSDTVVGGDGWGDAGCVIARYSCS